MLTESLDLSKVKCSSRAQFLCTSVNLVLYISREFIDRWNNRYSLKKTASQTCRFKSQ